MSTTATDIEPGAEIDDGWEPRGHPVRWALGLVTTIAALAAVSIWFGAVAPRADIDALSWGVDQSDTGELYLVAEVTNDAHTAVDLVDAGESLPGLELIAVGVGPDPDPVPGPDDAQLGGPVKIGPGESVTIELRYQLTDCDRVPLDDAGVPFSLRTILGRSQDRSLDSLGSDANGAPVDWARSLLSDACGLDPADNPATDEMEVDLETDVKDEG